YSCLLFKPNAIVLCMFWQTRREAGTQSLRSLRMIVHGIAGLPAGDELIREGPLFCRAGLRDVHGAGGPGAECIPTPRACRLRFFTATYWRKHGIGGVCRAPVHLRQRPMRSLLC